MAEQNNEINRGEYPVFSWCSIELETFNYSRRCFMSGEYCSKQDTIIRERLALRERDTINAFVVMNFSSVSDVIYKWKLQTFIESLKNHLYFNRTKSRLYCFNRQPNREGKSCISDDVIDALAKKEGENAKDLKEQLSQPLGVHSNSSTEGSKGLPLIPVKEINVLRADTSPSTNFVMCNRICQQLQIADIIVVDVSVENANVFYELGMAVAYGKMILPICYSESFYRKDIPLPIKAPEEKNGSAFVNEEKQYNSKYEHHIDCYPWRRTLFEHFGIRYRNNEKEYDQKIRAIRDTKDEPVVGGEEDNSWVTQYFQFEEVKKKKYGFSDAMYDQFPYLDKISRLTGFEYIPSIGSFGNETEQTDTKKKTIGECIYRKLQTSYNLATSNENTLVVYTMDGFINEAQAAQCIVNYYNVIVRQFGEQNCFCGERVGVLLQPISVPEDPKDGNAMLHYSIDEIIRIGMNQATYRTHMEMVKPDSFMVESSKIDFNKFVHPETKERFETKEQFNQWKESVERQTKEFIRNRCISVYPTRPVHVRRVKDGLLQDAFQDISLKSTNYSRDKGEWARLFFCYYHVMLKTLKYTNEIVVDTEHNTVQSFFWLGAAHASNTPAIIVCHENTEWEKRSMAEQKKPRSIFDVAGLWTAIYRTDNAAGFFDQLYRAQSGIEQYSKLIMKRRSSIAEKLSEQFWEPKTDISKIKEIADDKEDAEEQTLEEFYRNRFWRSMLSCNRLHLYVSPHPSQYSEPNGIKWDIKSVALLSNYLARKKAISDYKVMSLEEKNPDNEAMNVNFICIGNETGGMIPKPTEYSTEEQDISKPGKRIDQTTTIAEYINSGLSQETELYRRILEPDYYDCQRGERCMMFKKYSNEHREESPLRTQLPHKDCFECLYNLATKKKEEKGTGLDQDALLKIHSSKLECGLISNAFIIDDDATQKKEIEAFHLELAQLIFFRDKDRFRVTISGASGPATLALSSVLVNPYVKKDVLVLPEHPPIIFADASEEEKKKVKQNYCSRKYPLSQIQQDIREVLLEKYDEELENRLNDIMKSYYSDSYFKDYFDRITDESLSEDAQQERRKVVKLSNEMYVNRVKACVKMYLSTVLYRYLFPFVSEDDITRICNGLKAFISSFRINKYSPFALEYPPNVFDSFGVVIDELVVHKSAEACHETLHVLLQRFRRVEVFYGVEVKNVFHKPYSKSNEGKQTNEENLNAEQPERVTKIEGIKQISSKSLKLRVVFDE